MLVVSNRDVWINKLTSILTGASFKPPLSHFLMFRSLFLDYLVN